MSSSADATRKRAQGRCGPSRRSEPPSGPTANSTKGRTKASEEKKKKRVQPRRPAGAGGGQQVHSWTNGGSRWVAAERTTHKSRTRPTGDRFCSLGGAAARTPAV